MTDYSGNSRSHKVADQLQKELANLIQFEMKDPRLGFVTVSGVKVSRDFAHADVYVSVLGKDDAQDAKTQTVDALNHAGGFLRSKLAKLIRLRTVPKLKFHYDDTTEEGNRLSALIDDALANDSALDSALEDKEN